MIDIARNNQPLSQMRKFVDAMADYKLNKLQFHLIDDEAWRLEIQAYPNLPKLEHAVAIRLTKRTSLHRFMPVTATRTQLKVLPTATSHVRNTSTSSATATNVAFR